MYDKPKSFPKDSVQTQREGKSLPQGDFEWRQCHKTGILATMWTDKKPIYVVSTGLRACATESVTVIHHNKVGQELVMPATLTVVRYNKCMGGVDMNDKMAKIDKSYQV